jgi:hypothetical protein
VYVLGHSDLQTVLVATAIRIAQCMGLDKQVDNHNSHMESPPSFESKVKDEVVRRIWWQLIIQDYFEIAFANRYSEAVNELSLNAY